jgi:hypothetical protein
MGYDKVRTLVRLFFGGVYSGGRAPSGSSGRGGGRCVAMVGLSGHLYYAAGAWTGILLHARGNPFRSLGVRVGY